MIYKLYKNGAKLFTIASETPYGRPDVEVSVILHVILIDMVHS